MKYKMILMVFLLFSQFFVVLYSQEVVEFGRFGKVTLYQASPQPKHVVLFVSGDGGWNHGVIDMAKAVAEQDSLVAGIDIVHYLKQLANSNEKCSYPAADFEQLSKFIQEKKSLPDYITPVLIGYSSGATLVYAILVQAPPDTFAAAISMGFCPDLPLKKPFCKGYGLEFEPGPKGKGYIFLPARNLKNSWVAFQGLADKVCNPQATGDFVKKVNTGEIVELEKVGHGFSVPKNWLPQFKQLFLSIYAKQNAKKSAVLVSAEVSDLPLVEVLPQQWKADFLAVIISGDGGWAAIDRSMGEFLAQEGVGVVGFNSLNYFWKRRTPEEASRALSRILNHYAAAWKKNKVLLIGYSLGADVLPFMISRLNAREQELIRVISLLGLSQSVDFEFHITDWMGSTSKSSVPVRPEVEKLKGKKILCICGADETDSLCHELPPDLVHTVTLKGGHHFGGDYKSIVDIILGEFQ
jgi:type IV secretory pathway VirJ component